MRFLCNILSRFPAYDMPGNLLVICIDRHDLSLPSDFHRRANVSKRNGVVIVLKIDMTIGFDQPGNGVKKDKWFLRKNKHCLFLLTGKYRSRNPFGCAMNSSVGDGVHPDCKLPLTIVFIAKRPACPEVSLHVSHP